MKENTKPASRLFRNHLNLPIRSSSSSSFTKGVMMMWDLQMYHESKDMEGETVEMPMLVRSSDLNEELGLVSHVFRCGLSLECVPAGCLLVPL